MGIEITSRFLIATKLEPSRLFLISLIDKASSPLSKLLGNDETSLPNLRSELLEDIGVIGYHVFNVIGIRQLRDTNNYLDDFKEELDRGYWRAISQRQEAISEIQEIHLKVQNALLTHTNFMNNLVKIDIEYEKLFQTVHPLLTTSSDFENAIIQDVNEIVNEVTSRFEQIISLLNVIKIEYLVPFTDLVQAELEGISKIMERLDPQNIKNNKPVELERPIAEELGRVCEIISGGLNDTVDVDNLLEMARHDAQLFIEHTLEIRLKLNDLQNVIEDLDHSFIVSS